MRLNWTTVNSSWPIDAIQYHASVSPLVQIKACRLLGDKPLPEPKATYCQLDPKEKWNFNQNTNCQMFSLKKMHLKTSAKWQPSCLGLNVFQLFYLQSGLPIHKNIIVDELMKVVTQHVLHHSWKYGKSWPFMWYIFNSLWPSDTIWWHRSGSTLA